MMVIVVLQISKRLKEEIDNMVSDLIMKEKAIKVPLLNDSVSLVDRMGFILSLNLSTFMALVGLSG